MVSLTVPCAMILIAVAAKSMPDNGRIGGSDETPRESTPGTPAAARQGLH
jgi:hypothetical protein